MALVFGALASRVLKPEWDQYAVYASWAGLALVRALHARRSGARSSHSSGGATRATARWPASACWWCWAFSSPSTTCRTPQNKRWDLTSNQQYSLSDQTVKLLQGLTAPVKFIVFEQEPNFERFRARLTEYDYQSNQVYVEYIDPDKQTGPARANTRSRPTARSSSSTWDGASA